MNGKLVIEDDGFIVARTRDWPVPDGLCRGVPTSGSTTIVCHLCRSPWGGLVYDSAIGTFRHRGECPKILV